MKVMQQLRPWGPREVRQCVGGQGTVTATVVTPGWLAEVLLVGGAGTGSLDSHKVDEALGEATESWA